MAYCGMRGYLRHRLEEYFVNIIAAIDKNRGIGKNGELLVRIPKDHKRFREMTTGKVVVLGRKTLATFPQGIPLPDRTNIVLSANPDFKVKGAQVVHSVDELLEELKEYDSDDVYVIGGESIYSQLLPYCDRAYMTEIDYAYDADSYFPDFLTGGEWEKVSESDEQIYFDLSYYFVEYRKNK